MQQQGAVDPFCDLIKKDGASTVTCGTTQWVSAEGGGYTVRFEISLTTDQDEASIQRAGELAFKTALEMTTNALGLLSGR